MKKFFISGIAAITVAGFAIRKFKKAIVGGIVMGIIVVFAIVNVNLNLQSESTQSTVSFSLTRIKAGTAEYIGTPDPGSGTKRLRDAYCRCISGAYGTTFECHSQGTGEKCTSTQKGSNACYGNGVNDMLCESTFQYWF